MGFVKEVVQAPSTFIAHQYDGTQQNLDDLAAALGPGSTAGLTRIDSSTYELDYVGVGVHDTDFVKIWEVRPDGTVTSPIDYVDDTTYAVSWPDA